MNRRLVVPSFAGFATFAVVPSASAQIAGDSAPHLAPFVSGGASLASRLPDAGGIHLELGMIQPLGHGFSLRLEAPDHVYGEAALAPCLVQDAAHCCQTMDRHVTAGIMDAMYGRRHRRGGIYRIAGAGIHGLRRVPPVIRSATSVVRATQPRTRSRCAPPSRG